jgi:hypothetical protein
MTVILDAGDVGKLAGQEVVKRPRLAELLWRGY